MSRGYRRYFVILITCLCLIALVIAAGWFVRWRGNDWNNAAELAAKLQTGGGFASTLTIPYSAFKRAIFLARQPDVVVVGSSRGLMFRQSAFSWRFSNLGGGTTYPEYAFHLVDKFFTSHKPKIVLYEIDYFAYMPDDAPVRERPSATWKQSGSVRTNPFFLPYRMVLSDRMAADQMLRLLSITPLPSLDFPVYGMTAVTNFEGGDGADGSAYILGTMDRVTSQTAEERFRDDLRCVRGEGDCRHPMRPFADYDHRRIGQLKRLFAELRELDIHVVPFLAPLPPSLVRELQRSDSYGYLQALRNDMRRDLPEIFDMTDIERLGATDCEFYDALHAGEVANLRVLRELATKDALLDQALDHRNVDKIIASYAGSIMAVSDDTSRSVAPLIDAYRAKDVCKGTPQ
ncbi:MAG: hypothetical protein H7Y60_06375 [Rhodospirillaceae bacterium]|nr:hypothetical protein [Rhodospirillales bacterium]